MGRAWRALRGEIGSIRGEIGSIRGQMTSLATNRTVVLANVGSMIGVATLVIASARFA
jgi:hypothetical protein